MNSLEDAFVNIGMEEDKYLGVSQEASEHMMKFSDFS